MIDVEEFFVTEESVNELYRRRIFSLFGDATPHGNDLRVLQEQHRQDWLRWYEQSETAEAKGRRVAVRPLIEAMLQDNIAEMMTVAEMAALAGVSEGSVHQYVKDNQSAFTLVRRGLYVVRDVASERAAAGRPTALPAQRATAPAAPVVQPTAQGRADAAAEALAQFTGHRQAPPS